MKFSLNRKIPLILSGLLLAAIVSGCTSSGTSDVLESASSTKAKTNENQDLRAFCPKITLRAGTETLRKYPKGVKADDEDANSKLKYQATINETVRECNYIAETLSMRVGVAGRIITGPLGSADSFELPIRIAVTRGDSVLYSKLHKHQVIIEPGKTIARFRFVDENLVIDKPEKPDVKIFIGFDEGPYKKKK